MKEWLCLTCQMQKALATDGSGQPPFMKPQTSPSSVSSPATSKKDVTANQNKDVISTEKAGAIDKARKDSSTHDAAQIKEEILQTAGVSGQTKEEKPSLPPAGDVPTSFAPQSKKAEPVISKLVKPMPAEALSVTTGGENVVQKRTPLSCKPSEVTSEQTKENVEEIKKTADQLVKPSPQVLDKTSGIQISPKSCPPVSQKKPALKEAEQKEVGQTEPEKKPDKPPEHEASTLKQSKADIELQESAKPETPKDALNVGGSTCPLCKVELNMDSKNPNFNTCTDCKSIVCNKCGFSPIPNVKVKKSVIIFFNHPEHSKQQNNWTSILWLKTFLR